MKFILVLLLPFLHSALSGTLRALPQNDKINYQKFDCVIIGAGWSGLAAANLLHKKGVKNIKILEARDYIGGRSRTIQGYFVDGLATEMGSAWTYDWTYISDLYHSMGLMHQALSFLIKWTYIILLVGFPQIGKNGSNQTTSEDLFIMHK